ncbi:STAS/SEC14 domain-containing protein [Shewanella submarina]|uniref:STAS/SEC14 domain-containing protein n=1 Tax=Shewanella submarina TaxID=2016376 RepID=A0ABV7GCR7_9GAMM|nr:STAS/SEC14 domain-containing protein [Shewanella submarina]MCL1039073.1 STAS/SEC14 domain-containing protein [Shewanella submarina]
MLTLLPDFPHDTVAVVAQDLLCSNDYAQVLEPAIESKLQDHASIRLWYEFDPSFKGITVGTLWNEAMLGFFHLSDFSRIVVLADDAVMRGMAQTLAGMMPCPVKIYSTSERESARAWLQQEPVAV